MQSTWTWSDDKIIYLDYCSYEATNTFIRESVMLQFIYQLYKGNFQLSQDFCVCVTWCVEVSVSSPCSIVASGQKISFK